MGVIEETQVPGNKTFLPTTSIKGSKVLNAKEEKLGKIEEIMIDEEQGRIAYEVLSVGGWLGAGNKLFAIPWESLERNRDDYILRVDKSVFEGSDGYDKEKFSLTLKELAYIFKRCGVQPYWK